MLERLFLKFFKYERFGASPVRLHSSNYEGKFHRLRNLLLWLPKSSFNAGHIFFDSEIKDIILQKKIKVIIGIRDPRDVLLSAANYILEKDHPYSSNFSSNTIEEVIDNLIEGIEGPIISVKPKQPDKPKFENLDHNLYGGIYETYKRFLRWTIINDAIIIKFEDLVGKKGGGSDTKQINSIKKIANACSVELTSDDLNFIGKNLYGHTSTFRKGKIGSWKEGFSLKNKNNFKKHCGDLLIQLGYEKDKNW